MHHCQRICSIIGPPRVLTAQHIYLLLSLFCGPKDFLFSHLCCCSLGNCATLLDQRTKTASVASAEMVAVYDVRRVFARCQRLIYKRLINGRTLTYAAISISIMWKQVFAPGQCIMHRMLNCESDRTLVYAAAHSV